MKVVRILAAPTIGLLSLIGLASAGEKPNVYENAADNRNTLTIVDGELIQEVAFQDYDIVSTALGGITVQKLDQPKKTVTLYRYIWKVVKNDRDIVLLISYGANPKEFMAELEKNKEEKGAGEGWPSGFEAAFYADKGRLVSADGKKVYVYRK